MELWSPNESGCSRTWSETPHERNTPIDVIHDADPVENLVLEEILTRFFSCTTTSRNRIHGAFYT
jgi:hypothetical protein